MNNYRLGVDVWEGEQVLDYQALKANGVDFVVIRLNDMNGGHHMDANFDEQWVAAGNAGMIRAPYFVYNPWVSGSANYEWLIDHLPIDYYGRVFVDVEVAYASKSKAQYAIDVAIFTTALFAGGNNYSIYTGQWFLGNLSPWPKVSYWWAAYNYLSLYPTPGKAMSWQQVRDILANIPPTPTNAAFCPGTVDMWQISGDRLIMPGSPKPIDINIYAGTYPELHAFFGEEAVTPPEEFDLVMVISAKVAGELIPKLVTVEVEVNWVRYTLEVDQEPVVVTPPALNLYRPAAELWSLNHNGYDHPAGGGPLTQVLSASTKGGKYTGPLDAAWQSYIRWNIGNTAETMAKITAVDFGPSQGINPDNGKLKWCYLAFPSGPGINVVKVLEIVGKWARIETLLNRTGGETPESHPWLFHRVCDANGNPVLVQGFPIICPLIGAACWIPLSALVKL